MTATVERVIPKFDDDSSEGRKLAIICSKGNLDMVYPGLILGNAALGEGVELHLAVAEGEPRAVHHRLGGHEPRHLVAYALEVRDPAAEIHEAAALAVDRQRTRRSRADGVEHRRVAREVKIGRAHV